MNNESPLSIPTINGYPQDWFERIFSVYEKMFHIICHWRDANENNKIPWPKSETLFIVALFLIA